jgi:hypothetical protein
MKYKHSKSSKNTLKIHYQGRRKDAKREGDRREKRKGGRNDETKKEPNLSWI